MTGSHATGEMEKQRETRSAWYADLLKTPKVTAPFQYTIGPKWRDSNFRCANSLGTGAPGRTRTFDPRLRRPMHYPTELRARAPFEKPVRSFFDNGFNSDAQVVATLTFGKQVISARRALVSMC